MKNQYFDYAGARREALILTYNAFHGAETALNASDMYFTGPLKTKYEELMAQLRSDMFLVGITKDEIKCV